MCRIAALAFAALAACSGGGPTGSPASFAAPEAEAPVSLHNDTPESILYVAAGEGTLALLHLPPALRPGELGTRLVVPGETVPVNDILGYLPDLGVNFFVYRMNAASGEARYAGSFLATAAELGRAGGVVTVTPSRL